MEAGRPTNLELLKFGSLERLFVACLFLLVFVIPPTPAARNNQDKSDEPNLAVRISLPKRTFRLGEIIPVHVELTNQGSKPFLISNFVSLGLGSQAHIEFELRDVRGQESPMAMATADNFSVRTSLPPGAALLGSWLLLKPGYSIKTKVNLDHDIFSSLGKPGTYKLAGRYFANSLLYPPIYSKLGLTEEDVKSMPFECWSGNIATNTVDIEIVGTQRKNRHD